MANDGASGADRSDNDKSSDRSSKSERAEREVADKSRNALSGNDTDVKDREPTPEDRAASQDKMQAEGQAAKGRVNTSASKAEAGQAKPETTPQPGTSDIVEAIKGGIQNAQANPVPAGSYKQADLTFSPPGTFQNPAAPMLGLGRVVRRAAFAGSATFAAAATNHVLNKGYDAAESRVFENPGHHIEGRITDIWDAANARAEQLGAQAHPGIFEAAANAELELRDFAVAHYQDTGEVYEHGYNAEAQAPLNELFAENLNEVYGIERSRGEARAMMADYADHWDIDTGDVPPEQWSDIASAPDPLEVVPNINDPRFADPVPAREAVELAPWVEGFTPAEPLPPNGGFTPVPTPPFVEEFPAGDGLDVPNHTGGAVPVIEGLDIISTPIPDMEQAIILENRRNEPGIVTGQGQPVGADWMRQGVIQGGAPIPEQIADRLRDREFATFDDFREAFWEEVAADPALAAQFNSQNRSRMASGLAPRAPVSDHVGERASFELDHIQALFRGGDVYNVENLQVMTPSAHIEKTRND